MIKSLPYFLAALFAFFLASDSRAQNGIPFSNLYGPVSVTAVPDPREPVLTVTIKVQSTTVARKKLTPTDNKFEFKEAVGSDSTQGRLTADFNLEKNTGKLIATPLIWTSRGKDPQRFEGRIASW